MVGGWCWWWVAGGGESGGVGWFWWWVARWGESGGVGWFGRWRWCWVAGRGGIRRRLAKRRETAGDTPRRRPQPRPVRHRHAPAPGAPAPGLQAPPGVPVVASPGMGGGPAPQPRAAAVPVVASPGMGGGPAASAAAVGCAGTASPGMGRRPRASAAAVGLCAMSGPPLLRQCSARPTPALAEGSRQAHPGCLSTELHSRGPHHPALARASGCTTPMQGWGRRELARSHQQHRSRRRSRRLRCRRQTAPTAGAGDWHSPIPAEQPSAPQAPSTSYSSQAASPMMSTPSSTNMPSTSAPSGCVAGLRLGLAAPGWLSAGRVAQPASASGELIACTRITNNQPRGRLWRGSEYRRGASCAHICCTTTGAGRHRRQSCCSQRGRGSGGCDFGRRDSTKPVAAHR